MRMTLILTMTLLVACFLGARETAAPLENIANVEFRLDERLFVAMCALHLAGYDYGLDKEPADSIRARVLAELDRAPVSAGLKAELRELYRRHNVEMSAFAQQSKYAAFSLMIGPAPDFPPRLDTRHPPVQVANLLGLEKLMARLYGEAGLRPLWLGQQPRVLDQLRQLEPVVKETILAVLAFGRIEAKLYLNRRLIITPDPVNAPGIVNAVNLEGNYYILVSPAVQADRYRRFLVHEYLHLLLDPHLEDWAGKFRGDEELRRRLKEADAPEAIQENPGLAARESVIAAVEEIIPGQGEAASPAAAGHAEALFVGLFREKLAGFAASGQNLVDYTAGLLPNISAADLAAAMPARVAPPADRPPDPPARPDPRLETLQSAEAWIRDGQLDRAEAALSTLLAKDPGDVNALFGLGQVRFGRGDYAQALQFFETVAAAPAAPLWLQGWSLVRGGNCLVRLERTAEAKLRFERAAALTGDDRGAAAAARRSLDRLAE